MSGVVPLLHPCANLISRGTASAMSVSNEMVSLVHLTVHMYTNNVSDVTNGQCHYASCAVSVCLLVCAFDGTFVLQV